MMSTSRRTLRNRRAGKGVSVIELLVSTGMMGVCMAGIVSLLQTTNSVNGRVTAKIDNMNGATRVCEMIARTLRQARNVGDACGKNVPMDNNGTVEAVLPSREFPSAENPLYGDGTGVSLPSSPWPAAPYSLSGSTLIVQVPKHDSSGFPIVDAHGEKADTYVYQLVPDPQHPEEFQLQMCEFPDGGGEGNAQITPQTLARGIVGPLDGERRPQVFQYVSRVEMRDAQDDGSANVSNVDSVIVNLQFRSTDRRVSAGSIMTSKTTVFMRNSVANGL